MSRGFRYSVGTGYVCCESCNVSIEQYSRNSPGALSTTMLFIWSIVVLVKPNIAELYGFGLCSVVSQACYKWCPTVSTIRKQ